MRSFRQILWRHATRFGIPTVVVGAIGLLLFNWAYYHEYPTHRRIVVSFVCWFIAMTIATGWNAWIEWRRATRASIE